MEDKFSEREKVLFKRVLSGRFKPTKASHVYKRMINKIGGHQGVLADTVRRCWYMLNHAIIERPSNAWDNFIVLDKSEIPDALECPGCGAKVLFEAWSKIRFDYECPKCNVHPLSSFKKWFDGQESIKRDEPIKVKDDRSHITEEENPSEGKSVIKDDDLDEALEYLSDVDSQSVTNEDIITAGDAD